MTDLMAIAIVRRLMLFAGIARDPSSFGDAADELGSWIARPRADFGGLSPRQMLELEDGEEMVLRCLGGSSTGVLPTARPTSS